MTSHPSGRVTVGVDGSPPATTAVAWAAREAAVRHAELRVVHARTASPLAAVLGSPPPLETDQRARSRAEQVLAGALDRAHRAAPGLPVSGTIVAGSPARALLTESHRTELLVVGHRGHTSLPGLLLGSVSSQVAAHAACPTTVVRPATGAPGRSAGRVVVGVDGSPRSEAAIGYAFAEAAWRHTGLTALHAWIPPAPDSLGEIVPRSFDVADVAGEATRLLAESIAGWCDKYPDVDVRPAVVRSRAAYALVDESAGAALLVVGSRGYGGFPGLLLGSVSQAALHHAGCPVAVVRD